MDPAAPSAPPRRVLIVANPISGRGRGEQLARELLESFRRSGIEVECLRTAARGDAPGFVRSVGTSVDLVVAVGGDGTLSEVFQGLADRRIPVGLLPCGTANVLAETLGLPRDVPRALAAFLGGRRQAIDVARVGERLSHLVVGVGFDAWIVREVERGRRGPITKWAYVGAALRTLRRYRPVPLTVTLDGTPLAEPVGFVLVCNTPRYADLLHLASDGRIDDGALEVYLFPTGRLAELARAFLRGVLAHWPGGAVGMLRARAVVIEAAEPVPYQVDGDLGGTTPVEIELLSERFQLVVP